jgi:hypothetical protein
MAVQVSTYLNIARVSQYFAADGNYKNLAFKGADNRARQATLLFMTRKVINWLNTLDSTDGRLPKMANYMYSLCNPYVAQALGVINAGTTGNIVNPSTGNNVTIATPSYQFKVGEVGALMLAGETTLTITLSGIVNPSAEITLDGTEVAYGRSDVFSYTATYSPTNIVIVFNNPVENDMLFFIHLIQLVNV